MLSALMSQHWKLLEAILHTINLSSVLFSSGLWQHGCFDDFVYHPVCRSKCRVFWKLEVAKENERTRASRKVKYDVCPTWLKLWGFGEGLCRVRDGADLYSVQISCFWQLGILPYSHYSMNSARARRLYREQLPIPVLLRRWYDGGEV